MFFTKNFFQNVYQMEFDIPCLEETLVYPGATWA